MTPVEYQWVICDQNFVKVILPVSETGIARANHNAEFFL